MVPVIHCQYHDTCKYSTSTVLREECSEDTHTCSSALTCRINQPGNESYQVSSNDTTPTHSRVSKRNACPAFRPTRLNSVSIARARDPQASSTPRDSRQHSLLGDDHRCITTHTRISESLKTFHLKLLCPLQLHSHAPQLRES